MAATIGATVHRPRCGRHNAAVATAHVRGKTVLAIRALSMWRRRRRLSRINFAEYWRRWLRRNGAPACDSVWRNGRLLLSAPSLATLVDRLRYAVPPNTLYLYIHYAHICLRSSRSHRIFSRPAEPDRYWPVTCSVFARACLLANCLMSKRAAHKHFLAFERFRLQ